MTDYLKIKPVRTFALGNALKTTANEPFAVEAGEARLLVAQGLASIVIDEPAVKRKAKANDSSKNP